MKKLLFFDIDGTVLTEGERRYVPESAEKAIRLLQENGHMCFINTGRCWSEIFSDITSIRFDGFVCGCGTYIRCHDEVLLEKELPLELADNILEDLNRCQLEWILEGQQNVYFSTQPYETRIGNFKKEYAWQIPGTCINVPPETRGLHFDKFCICSCSGSNLEGFIHKYQNTLCFIDRGNDFYEIIPKGYTKASGIQFLMDYFHIPLEDTIAIGDSTNDLPMLRFAGLSIGMKESDAEVLETVDYVTDTVENDGIYKAMKHFQLI